MSMLKAKIEGLLFVAAKALHEKKIAEVVGAKREDVTKVVDELAEEYDSRNGGLRIIRHGRDVRMSTSAEIAKVMQQYLKDETTGELTKPSLETLTIVAYRGPITKGELEQVRGVNCSLILRNLMMRGLVGSDGEHGMPTTTYDVTPDFLRFLGIPSIERLPEYDKLRSHENVVRVLEDVVREGTQVEEKEGEKTVATEDKSG